MRAAGQGRGQIDTGRGQAISRCQQQAADQCRMQEDENGEKACLGAWVSKPSEQPHRFRSEAHTPHFSLPHLLLGQVAQRVAGVDTALGDGDATV